MASELEQDKPDPVPEVLEVQKEPEQIVTVPEPIRMPSRRDVAELSDLQGYLVAAN